MQFLKGKDPSNFHSHRSDFNHLNERFPSKRNILVEEEKKKISSPSDTQFKLLAIKLLPVYRHGDLRNEVFPKFC